MTSGYNDTRPREMGPRDLDYDIRPSSPPDPQTPALTSISMFYRDSQLHFFFPKIKLKFLNISNLHLTLKILGSSHVK